MSSDDGLSLLTLLIIIALVVAFKGGIGYLIGKNKGRGGLGFVLGLCLGIIGWIIIAVIPGEQTSVGPRLKPRRCRQCQKPIPRGMVRCPRCKAGASAPPTADVGRTPCPHCAELIMPGAHVCRFCHNKV